jgi:uncharacterized lipoprotein NlpE involved in copper resistance
VRYHLNLFDDDSFLLRTTRLGKTGGTTDDLGSWTLSSDRRLIVLQGRNDAMQLFEIVAPGTIRKLEADGRPNTSRGSSQLTRSSQFRPTDVRATMRGAYTYLADAATFVECSTGQRWTVAAENVSRELEAAYLKVRPAPGASVVVDVDGLLVQRPRADGGMQSALVVERVRGLLPKQSCPARFSGVPLTDTHWRLTHLGDRAVPVGDRPSPRTVLDAARGHEFIRRLQRLQPPGRLLRDQRIHDDADVRGNDGRVQGGSEDRVGVSHRAPGDPDVSRHRTSARTDRREGCSSRPLRSAPADGNYG